jgi:hypothetical protein
MKLHPDNDKLYQRLLPIYRTLDKVAMDKVVESFSLLWEGVPRGGKFTAGEAIERALIGHGVLLPNPTIMEEDEYEDILRAQEIYDAC